MFPSICKIVLCSLLVLAKFLPVYGQSTFIPLNDDYYHLIDRLEIKRGRFSEGFHANMKPYQRQAVVALADSVFMENAANLTTMDRATIEYLRRDSREWIMPPVRDSARALISLDSAAVVQAKRDSVAASLSRLSVFAPVAPRPKKRTFFTYPVDLYSLHNEDIDLHVNFATNNYVGRENTTDETLWFTGRGVEIRGIINKKLGFYTFVSDNQGTFPKYVRDYTFQYNFPGEGLAKTVKQNGVDFLSARGYITFRPLKNINVQFGNDRNFIGSGYRSLFLSDNSSPYLFLRIDTQLGKFQYTNLWASMIGHDLLANNDRRRSRKQTAMHHLSVNLSDRFNIGIFEAEVIGRDSSGVGPGLDYFNPIIFYRYVESYLGSFDNALLGADFRWLVGRRVSVYGQFVLDEFVTKFYFNRLGSWTKKYGAQLGFKYVDAFGIQNLDIQGEWNVVRPFTYAHEDGGRDYTHYRQPLAHPLGANFVEVLGVLRYKITPRLTAYGTVTWSDKGIDTNGRNYGGTPIINYNSRVSDFGNYITQGVPLTTRFADLRLSYMLAHNLFIEGRLLRRREESPCFITRQSTTLATAALRFNIPYRQQTF